MDRPGCMLMARSFLLYLSAAWLLAATRAQQSNFTRPVFQCGGDLVSDSGFVGSEDFPSYYKPNSKCTWRITVPEGNVVMLTFRVMDLEADSLCRYDYLDAYNGHSNMKQKLGRFCGTFRPGALISTSNTLMLDMVSDDGNQGRGFVAYFSGIAPTADEQQFCGGRITKAQGEITTPGWPMNKYPPGTSCSWLITVDPGMVIMVRFDKFLLEADTYCRFDYVAFFNGGERDNSRLIGKFCGDRAPEPLVSNGNVLLVQFVSDLSVTSDGFLASYTAVPHGTAVDSAPRLDRPVTRTTTTRAPTTTTTVKPRGPKPPRTRTRVTPGLIGAPRPGNGKRPVMGNPLCAKACKRDGTIKTSYCASEFVLTGKVTALTPGPRGSVHVSVTLIRTYKEGRLSVTEGAARTVKMVAQCRKCPVLRKGADYILMGGVDEDGRGTLSHGAFTALYKTPHGKLLTSLGKQPC
ncbi:procollagen C-endopeptidase enhancer a [Gadus morhua]|uniref:Procollagen C-endopeptidase enhancer a n=1 Tax=Gadus morhua TaxID=8049 RepID=A0A8C4ZN08_GADMO|nr:procollagen C-endopeptidase enhancer 2-like [Gadus morhua]